MFSGPIFEEAPQKKNSTSRSPPIPLTISASTAIMNQRQISMIGQSQFHIICLKELKKYIMVKKMAKRKHTRGLPEWTTKMCH